MLSELEKAQRKVVRAREKLEAAEDAVNTILCRTQLACYWCKAIHEIFKLIYIQEYLYVRPYGCTEGDYWRAGEGLFDCPSCGKRNRLYDRPEIMSLKRLFKEIQDQRDE